MQPLVPLVLPSLYPPSFRRNDFLYLYNSVYGGKWKQGVAYTIPDFLVPPTLCASEDLQEGVITACLRF